MRETDERRSSRNSRLIFLVGFMGAGKTTVGRELARILEFRFCDLDEIIEKRAGATIKEIFESAGEVEFRRIEGEAIRHCLDLDDSVIALGGGAFVSEENRKLLASAGATVWLDCPLEVCLQRLGVDAARPLLGDRDEMRLLLQKRIPAYAEAAYRVKSGGQSPADIALEIASMLANYSELPKNAT